MLRLKGYSSGGAVLTLHQLSHAAGETVAGEIGGRALRLLASGRRAVSTVGPAVESNADLAMLFRIAARCIRHQPDNDDDEGGAEDDRPLSLWFGHNLYPHEEVSHLAELIVAALNGFVRCERR